MKYTESEGSAIIENFLTTLETNSEIAQTVPGHSTKSIEQYTGAARKMVDAITDSVAKYGAAATGEALEDTADSYPDVYNTTMFYASINDDIEGMQDDFASAFADTLERNAETLLDEAEEITENDGEDNGPQEGFQGDDGTEKPSGVIEKAKDVISKVAKGVSGAVGKAVEAVKNIGGRIRRGFGKLFGR